MKDFKLSDGQYNFLKWFVIVFMPAFTTFVGVVGTAINWGPVELVLIILTAFTTFLGSLIGVSNMNYKK